jgi:hypothetical protein
MQFIENIKRKRKIYLAKFALFILITAITAYIIITTIVLGCNGDDVVIFLICLFLLVTYSVMIIRINLSFKRSCRDRLLEYLLESFAFLTKKRARVIALISQSNLFPEPIKTAYNYYRTTEHFYSIGNINDIQFIFTEISCNIYKYDSRYYKTRSSDSMSNTRPDAWNFFNKSFIVFNIKIPSIDKLMLLPARYKKHYGIKLKLRNIYKSWGKCPYKNLEVKKHNNKKIYIYSNSPYDKNQLEPIITLFNHIRDTYNIEICFSIINEKIFITISNKTRFSIFNIIKSAEEFERLRSLYATIFDEMETIITRLKSSNLDIIATDIYV